MFRVHIRLSVLFTLKNSVLLTDSIMVRLIDNLQEQVNGVTPDHELTRVLSIMVTEVFFFFGPD